MFAKLFDTPNGQLLLTLTSDEDTGLPSMSARGEGNEMLDAELEFTYASVLARDVMFERFSQADADRLAAELAGAVAAVIVEG